MAQTTKKKTKAPAAKAPAASTRKRAAKSTTAKTAKSTTAKTAKSPTAKTAKSTKSTTAKSPTAKTAKSTKSTTAKRKTAIDRTADLSDEVLKSVETGQRDAIEAVRKFVDTVDEALPAIGDRPSRREQVIDAALDMADKLVTTQYDFLRSVVRSADRSLSEPGAAKK